MVTVSCPLTTTGVGTTEVQAAGEARFVADCKAYPAVLYPLTPGGHVKMTFVPEAVMVNGGGVGSETLNSVPLPKLPPIYAVP